MTIRVGLLGAGQISPLHLQAWQKAVGAEVVVVCDIDINRAKIRQQEYGIPEISTDFHEVIKREDLDVIDVCLPTHLHAQATILAASTGKHVFCEKPMAMNLPDARAMTQACKDAGVKLQLGFCRRFDNQWLKFKETILEGKIGRPVVWRTGSGSWGAPSPWFFQLELGGGPFLDGAVHNYDFGRFLFGDVAKVWARLDNIGKKGDAPDTGMAQLTFASGDQLQMVWSWGLPEGVYAGGFHDILGPGGALHFDAIGRDPLEARDENLGELTVIGPGGKKIPITYPISHMYIDEIAHFVQCIREDLQPKVGGVDGEKALEIALAVLESGQTGREVYLR